MSAHRYQLQAIGFTPEKQKQNNLILFWLALKQKTHSHKSETNLKARVLGEKEENKRHKSVTKKKHTMIIQIHSVTIYVHVIVFDE